MAQLHLAIADVAWFLFAQCGLFRARIKLASAAKQVPEPDVSMTDAAQWIESAGEVGRNLETLNAYNYVYTKL